MRVHLFRWSTTVCWVVKPSLSMPQKNLVLCTSPNVQVRAGSRNSSPNNRLTQGIPRHHIKTDSGPMLSFPHDQLDGSPSCGFAKERMKMNLEWHTLFCSRLGLICKIHMHATLTLSRAVAVTARISVQGRINVFLLDKHHFLTQNCWTKGSTNVQLSRNNSARLTGSTCASPLNFFHGSFLV
jgi:hypothetical protein